MKYAYPTNVAVAYLSKIRIVRVYYV